VSKGNIITLALLAVTFVLAVVVVGAVLRERNVALNHALLTNAFLAGQGVVMIAGVIILWRIDCSLRHLDWLLAKYLAILLDVDASELKPSLRGLFRWLSESVKEEAELMRDELIRPEFASPNAE